MSRIWPVLALIALALAIVVSLMTVSRADMMFMYGAGRGSSGPPTCIVNLSAKLNDKCSSIFMRR